MAGPQVTATKVAGVHRSARSTVCVRAVWDIGVDIFAELHSLPGLQLGCFGGVRMTVPDRDPQ